MNRLGPGAIAAMNGARQEAREMGHAKIGAHHMLVASFAVAAETMKSMQGRNLAWDSLHRRLRDLLPEGQEHQTGFSFDDTANAALSKAYRTMAELGAQTMGAELLFLGALESGSDTVRQLLAGFDQNPAVLAVALRSELGLQVFKDTADRPGYTQPAHAQEQGTALVGAGPAPARGPQTRTQDSRVLAAFATDLVELARQGRLDPVIGRDKETERVMTALVRRTKNSPVLLGAPGVGKTAVVEGLAARIASGDVPPELANKSIWAIDMGALVAKTTLRGDFEDRLRKLLAELRATSSIAFIDEVHSMVGAGATTGSLGAGSMITAAMGRREISLIGATTPEEYKKFIMSSPTLEHYFQPVVVEPPDETTSYWILEALRPLYEGHHGVRYTDEALHAAVSLTARYVHDRQLPDKAIDVIDEAGSAAAMRIMRATGPVAEAMARRAEAIRSWAAASSARDMPAVSQAIADESHFDVVVADHLVTRQADGPRPEQLSDGPQASPGARPGDPGVIDAQHVAAIVSSWAGVPLGAVMAEEGQLLVNLEASLSQRVVGQQEAISALARAVRRRRTGLGSTDRPPSFMFAGSTGVGKTETARALAEVLFGSQDAIVRFDMSEYMEAHTVSRLIGAPPGYAGHDSPGQLTEAVDRKPYCVVLLDELEKAHPDVLNVLLQVLDEGRLTDSQGRSHHFENTIIIMTTNVGATEGLRRQPGFVGSANSSQVRRAAKVAAIEAAMKKAWRPELLNRIDEVVVFNDLDHEALGKVADLVFARVLAQAGSLGYFLTMDDAAREQLIGVALADPDYGARPIRRAMQALVENPLAEAILAGLPKGDVVIRSAGPGARCSIEPVGSHDERDMARSCAHAEVVVA